MVTAHSVYIDDPHGLGKEKMENEIRSRGFWMREGERRYDWGEGEVQARCEGAGKEEGRREGDLNGHDMQASEAAWSVAFPSSYRPAVCIKCPK